MTRYLRYIALVILTAGALVIAAPAAASAQAADGVDTAAQPSESYVTSTLVVFGAGILVTAEIDDAGHLTEVQLVDMSGSAPADAEATTVSPHAVWFVDETTGTTVHVASTSDTVTSEVTLSGLAELVGPHRWSGLLFGPDETISELVFRVSDNAGSPGVELVDVSTPGTATNAVTSTSDETSETAVLQVDILLPTGEDATISVRVTTRTVVAGAEATLGVSVSGSELVFGEHAPAADALLPGPTTNVADILPAEQVVLDLVPLPVEGVDEEADDETTPEPDPEPTVEADPEPVVADVDDCDRHGHHHAGHDSHGRGHDCHKDSDKEEHKEREKEEREAEKARREAEKAERDRLDSEGRGHHDHTHDHTPGHHDDDEHGKHRDDD
jgi:hypothetical protein